MQTPDTWKPKTQKKTSKLVQSPTEGHLEVIIKQPTGYRGIENV